MQTNPRRSNIYLYAGVGIIALTLAASFVYVRPMPLNVDETFHYPQITRLLKHDFGLNPAIVTPPGYHYLVFAIASLFGAESVTAIRLISFGISLASIGVFALFVNQLKPEEVTSKTFQYTFFPLLYPFLFLIYTEVTSLLFVFLAVYLTLRQKYYLGGIIGIVACLVRQDNIIWVGFMFLLMTINLVGELPASTSPRLTESAYGARLLRPIVRSGATYLVAFGLFATFVVINKGVAIGDREMHPEFALYAANVYGLLFTFFFMFLPMNIANAPKIVTLIRQHRLAVVYIAGFFLLFMVTFKVDHPYNIQPWAQWFLSNKILTFSVKSPLTKSLFFLPVLYSVLSLFCTRLYAKQYYLIYPLSIVQLVPNWLVDPRYYLLPCLLFLAFKEDESKPLRYITYSMYVLLSGYFLHSIVTLEYFF